MKWSINICMDIPETTNWDPTATNISDTLYEMDGIQDCWFVSKKHITKNQYQLEFCVVAEAMPIAQKLMSELQKYFNPSQLNVTRECWNPKEIVPFQWLNEGISVYRDGSSYHMDFWSFCINNFPVFTVYYIPKYTEGWTDWRRKQHFGNAQFAWAGMTGGCTALKATTIDEALKEFEDIYVNMTRASIQATEKKLHDLNQELEDFLKWKEN